VRDKELELARCILPVGVEIYESDIGWMCGFNSGAFNIGFNNDKFIVDDMSDPFAEAFWVDVADPECIRLVTDFLVKRTMPRDWYE